jgi:ABC-type uncharacterized transport system permease subunit
VRVSPSRLAVLLGPAVRFLPREIVTNGTVLRSAFATAAVPASWFALLLGVPVAFCLLVVLPVAGLVTLLLGGRADPAPAT